MLYAARRPANGELERLKIWEQHIYETEKIIKKLSSAK